MIRKKLKKFLPLGGLGMKVLIVFIVSYFIGLWTQSNIQYWIDYMGKDAEVPYWLAWLISVALNVVIFVLNLISEVMELMF